MEDTFPQMIDSLSKAATKIEAELSKLFASQRKPLTDQQWTEYGDNLEALQYRLKQLNTVLHFEYEFEENLANDVINYSKLVNENRESCEELIGYLLSRNYDSWTRNEVDFLNEVINGIIANSTVIEELLQ